jgi:membrane-associated protein
VLNPLAGVVRVLARVFTLWQILGVVWSAWVARAGYRLGSHIPNVDRCLLPLIALIVPVSLIPLAVEVLPARRARRSV